MQVRRNELSVDELDWSNLWPTSVTLHIEPSCNGCAFWLLDGVRRRPVCSKDSYDLQDHVALRSLLSVMARMFLQRLQAWCETYQLEAYFAQYTLSQTSLCLNLESQTPGSLKLLNTSDMNVHNLYNC